MSSSLLGTASIEREAHGCSAVCSSLKSWDDRPAGSHCPAVHSSFERPANREVTSLHPKVNKDRRERAPCVNHTRGSPCLSFGPRRTPRAVRRVALRQQNVRNERWAHERAARGTGPRLAIAWLCVTLSRMTLVSSRRLFKKVGKSRRFYYIDCAV